MMPLVTIEAPVDRGEIYAGISALWAISGMVFKAMKSGSRVKHGVRGHCPAMMSVMRID